MKKGNSRLRKNHIEQLESVLAQKLKPASLSEILSWSSGKVGTPELLNNRTSLPNHNGLFCCRLFGPVDDLCCLCTKYRGEKYRGVKCEKCGVFVENTSMRNERFAHIELAAPIAHPWFLETLQYQASLSSKEFEQILDYQLFVVLDPGPTSLPYGTRVTYPEFVSLSAKYQDTFSIGYGAKVLSDLCSVSLQEDERERLFLKALPILPPGLRPLRIKEKNPQRTEQITRKFLESQEQVAQEYMTRAQRYAIPEEEQREYLEYLRISQERQRNGLTLEGVAEGLNRRYQRIIIQNQRLLHFLQLNTPLLILAAEEKELYQAILSLFHGRTGARKHNSPVSLWEQLEGVDTLPSNEQVKRLKGAALLPE